MLNKIKQLSVAERAVIKGAPLAFAGAVITATGLLLLGMYFVLDKVVYATQLSNKQSTIDLQDHELSDYRQKEQICISKESAKDDATKTMVQAAVNEIFFSQMFPSAGFANNESPGNKVATTGRASRESNAETKPRSVTNNVRGTGNAVSTNQSGGITAGILNINEKPDRILSEPEKLNLLSSFPDKTMPIQVRFMGGSYERASYAAQIGKFLKSRGYENMGVFGIDSETMLPGMHIVVAPAGQTSHVYIGENK